MINLTDYVNPNTGSVDLPKFNEARRQVGELCMHCNGNVLDPPGQPTLCLDCTLNPKDGTASHIHIICPYCNYKTEPWNDLNDDIIQTSCPNCLEFFTVQATCVWTFTSRRLV